MPSSPSLPILPGATIGVLGSGQLGRMFAMAARSLGYRIVIFSPECAPPAGPVADREFVAEYTDLEKIRAFASEVDVVTFEFENVPALATSAAAEIVPVHPGGEVLHTTQNRLREKSFLQSAGFPVTPFRAINTLADIEQAATALKLPAILKTADFGYDGKGQVKLNTASELAGAFAGLRGAPGILEGMVDFEKELSVVAARTAAGEFAAFPVFENVHANHILDVTFSPARLDPALATEAVELARGILEKLAVTGLLTVELFLTRGGKLLVNELAPRTHNSGHLTLDASVTSQFEQQVRAVCGLPLGSTASRGPAAMANLLGHLWDQGEPNWAAALSDPAIKLHLYGKKAARAGRKMGHLTTVGSSIDDAVRRVREARDHLSLPNHEAL